MKNLWKKIVVWGLVLSLVIPANIFLDGGMTIRAAEAVGEDTKKEQKLTVTCDSAEIAEDGTISLLYGQEIFLQTGTDGDGALSYSVEQKPTKPDEKVITTESSGEVTDSTGDAEQPGDEGTGNTGGTERSGEGTGDTGQPGNEGTGGTGDTEQSGDEGTGGTGDTEQPKEENGIALKTVGIGSAVITITAAETEDYEQAEKVITVNVGKAEHDLLVKAGGTEVPAEYNMSYTDKPFTFEIVSESVSEESAELTFLSDDESVASIDEKTGEVTLKGLGTATITVTASETAHYVSTSVKIQLTVVTSLPDPVMSSLTVQDGSIKVKWAKVPGATGYLVYREVGSDDWEEIANIPDGDTVTYVDANVTAGKNHAYRIKAFAYSGVDTSGYSEKMTTRYLQLPSFRLVTVSTGNKVMWDKSEGASYYRIYRRENASQSWKKLKQVAETGSFSWTDTKAENGKSYEYTVRAFYKLSDTNTAKSAIAPPQSIYFLQRPTLKKLKRKSATKILVQWDRNAQADGYQIQYARNGLFAGAASVSVGKNTTVSRTLTKLAKKKTYYVRVRAFKNVNGVTYYSAWGLSKNAMKQRTASKSALQKKQKKKKTVFELREFTKQKLYQYDTVQGGCTDGTYGYFIMYNRNVTKCKVAKIKLSNLKVVKVSSAMKLDHGNDMTYNPDTKKLVVLHTDPNHMRISTINKSTLKLESTRDVVIPDVLMGASDKERNAVKGFSGISYSSAKKQYVLRQRGDSHLVICDADLNPVSYVKISSNNYMYQGMDATDDYILLGRSPYGKYNSNAISVYTWDGEYVTDIKIKSGYELENVFHVGDQFYTGFYCSYYKTYYTKEKKTVLVKGKKKTKTVKVKHRKFVRDNYIYKLGSI